MAEINDTSGNPLPAESLVTLTHVMYALHALTAITGILSPAFIVTAFLTGWPSIIAVILNYAKRDQVWGTYLESHFHWQIRTFWFALLWVVAAWLFIFTLIGIPVAIGVFWLHVDMLDFSPKPAKLSVRRIKKRGRCLPRQARALRPGRDLIRE